VNAVDINWNVAVGNWTNSSNWTPAGPPTSADVANIGNYIQAPATCTVTAAGAECNRFVLGGATGKAGTLEIESGSLTVQSSPSIGYVDRGVVVQTGGTLDVNGGNVDMGNGAGGDGEYRLSGGELIGHSTLTIGYVSNGMASFYLSSNGVVRASSQATYVGRLAGSTGAIVQTGGTWDHNGHTLLMANQDQSVATYLLSGGLITNYYEIIVGNQGSATFEMIGGRIEGATERSTVGNASGGVGLLTQSGGVWDNNSSNFFLGNLGGSKGTYEISGGVLTNVLGMFNGNGGTGTFSIVGSSASIHMETFSVSSVSTLRVAPSNGALSVLNSDNINLDGTLEVDFGNYDAGQGYPETLLMIKYSSWGGNYDFAVTNILTPGWSADVEYDDAADEVKLVNIIGPPKGSVFIVK